MFAGIHKIWGQDRGHVKYIAKHAEDLCPQSYRIPSLHKGKHQAPIHQKGNQRCRLAAAKPANKAYKIAAGGGLYLEVTPTGSKLWRWKYRLHGKENRFAIGRYPDIPEGSQRSCRSCPKASQGRAASVTAKADQPALSGTGSEKHVRGYCPRVDRGTGLGGGYQERRLNMLERVVFPHIGKFPAKQIVPEQILDILKRAARKQWNQRCQ